MVGDILQPTHLLLLLIVALVVLGPKRLPEAGRALGNGLRDFRAAISGESSRDEQPRHDGLPSADASDSYVQESRPASEARAPASFDHPEAASSEPLEAAHPAEPAPITASAPVAAPAPITGPATVAAPAPITAPAPVAEPGPVEPGQSAEHTNDESGPAAPSVGPTEHPGSPR